MILCVVVVLRCVKVVVCCGDGNDDGLYDIIIFIIIIIISLSLSLLVLLSIVVVLVLVVHSMLTTIVVWWSSL